jgi:hypothetical protein
MAKPKTKTKPKAKAKTKGKTKPAGLAFRDPNLRLALLDEVLQDTDEDYVKLARAYAAFRKTAPKAATWEVITSGEGYDHQPQFEQFMLAQPIKAKDLAELTDLTLDGDRELYAWIYPYWWDAGDSHFEIHDLTDLAYCPALEDLSLGQGLVGECSLAPLAKLANLTELSLCATCNYSELDGLLAVPALKKLEVLNATKPWRDVIDRLQDKGVEVRA